MYEKVSFHIASEASYVYILSDKNAKNGQIWRVFENLKFVNKQCYQTGQFEYVKNWWKMPKFKCDIFSDFQTMCPARH